MTKKRGGDVFAILVNLLLSTPTRRIVQVATKETLSRICGLCILRRVCQWTTSLLSQCSIFSRLLERWHLTDFYEDLRHVFDNIRLLHNEKHVAQLPSASIFFHFSSTQLRRCELPRVQPSYQHRRPCFGWASQPRSRLEALEVSPIQSSSEKCSENRS